MKFRDYPKKFKDRVEVAGRSYKRWGVTGTFATTEDSVNWCEGKYYVAPGDIVRWHSNNRIPFGDILLDLCEALKITPKQLRVSSELEKKKQMNIGQTILRRKNNGTSNRYTNNE